MNKLKCEMCGGTNFIKQDGVFVCQYCGCKYTVEEAKKMMVSGTVAIDNSSFVMSSLQNGRRAKQKEDWEEVQKYYNFAEQYDPTNTEAVFYSAYGKARQALINENLFARQAVFNSFVKTISILDDNYDVDKDYDEYLKTFEQITKDLLDMYNSSFVYRTQRSGIIEIGSDKAETAYLFADVRDAYCETLINIAGKYKKDPKACPYYDFAISMLENALRNRIVRMRTSEEDEILDKIIEYNKKINEIDPSHQIPSRKEVIKKCGVKSFGCYIATCAYGSYDCPPVWVLRRFRDEKLGHSFWGRMFIRIYYAISPILVKLFGNCKWFKNFFRKRLDKLVTKLQNEGLADTPYQDQDWRKS